MQRTVLLIVVLLTGLASAQVEVTLEKIMSHPRWIGLWPEQVQFAPDGRSIMALRHADPRGYEVMELDRNGKTLAIHRLPSSMPSSVSRGEGTLFAWQGDLVLARDDRRTRLSRTDWAESEPRWLDGQSFVYKAQERLLIRNLGDDSTRQVAEFLSQDPPEPDKDFRHQQQDRLFPLLKEQDDHQEELRESRGIPRIYLGKGQELVRAELSLDRKHLLLVSAKKQASKPDLMPRYVNRSGRVETQKLRTKVGAESPRWHRLHIVDLTTGSKRAIALDRLPAYNAKSPIRLEDLSWSRQGRLALFLLSQDFEHRWLVEVDFKQARLGLIEHLHDPAWHSWDLNEFGWTPDGKTFWYQSERTGYAHLYLWDGKTSRALTSGQYEVSGIRPAPDNQNFFFRANKSRPSRYDVYSVDRAGKLEQVSDLGGDTTFDLSPDGKELVLLHSKIEQPPEVFLQSSRAGSKARQLTQFASDDFLSTDWTVPEIVAVPSTHHSRTIPSKVYRPDRRNGAAVVFVHGAGYLQNAHEGWSYYFREFMFHTLLTRMGVTVMDMDYRASAGYGREWRTAIYRQMGTPELEDLKDGVAYLVTHEGVDPERVGVYGGSYGGFMTLMALFKEPDLFACGAALRPVTDWAQYEHEYTARILNTPDKDPEAFLRSSPIEFAEGLTKPLLMAHGMLDDNVVVQDTVRLAQRLIQLKKENWEMALYPLEPHGFREPESWLDEYRRVFKLFRVHLRL